MPNPRRLRMLGVGRLRRRLGDSDRIIYPPTPARLASYATGYLPEGGAGSLTWSFTNAEVPDDAVIDYIQFRIAAQTSYQGGSGDGGSFSFAVTGGGSTSVYGAESAWYINGPFNLSCAGMTVAQARALSVNTVFHSGRGPVGDVGYLDTSNASGGSVPSAQIFFK